MIIATKAERNVYMKKIIIATLCLTLSPIFSTTALASIAEEKTTTVTARIEPGPLVVSTPTTFDFGSQQINGDPWVKTLEGKIDIKDFRGSNKPFNIQVKANKVSAYELNLVADKTSDTADNLMVTSAKVNENNRLFIKDKSGDSFITSTKLNATLTVPARVKAGVLPVMTITWLVVTEP